MFKGFYNLASGMLTQTRVLNTISNNIANASTPGYKSDTMTTTTFKDVLMYRTGNKDKSSAAYLNNSESMIRTVEELVTNFTQGSWDETNQPLDFAISGPGFFQIQTPNGIAYTRNGSFTLDNEGYLYLPGGGRVMGENGPIYLGTDKVFSDSSGVIFTEDGTAAERLIVVDFDDYNELVKMGNGLFSAAWAPTVRDSSPVMWKTLERSNVDAAGEMTDMMASQRALQSSAQVLKMYDQLMAKAVELGRV